MQTTSIFIIVVAVLIIFAFCIWTIVDSIRNPNYDDTRRIMWILVIVLPGLIGSIIYLAMAPGGNEPESFQTIVIN